MTRTKANGPSGAKRGSGPGTKTAKTHAASRRDTAQTAAAPAKAAATVAPVGAKAHAGPNAAGRRPRGGSASGSASKDPLQASIERQSQLQLMIRTQNSARAWARNVRQMQIVLLFAWFGLWSFLEPFLDIGHRVTHAWGLQSHRSAKHDVLILNGALVEGLFSITVAIGVGLLIYKGVQRAVKA